MIAKIIYILGIVLNIWCVIDIIKKKCDIVKKILLIILILATSWLGFCLYYFWLRHKIN